LPKKPAFIVVADHRVDDGDTNPQDPPSAAAWFHGHSDPAVSAIKVLKYVPTNYSRSKAPGCPVYDDTPHSLCDNAPSSGPPNCGPLSIQTRIARVLAAGYDGVFFDETQTPEASVGYVQDCARIVKENDPNKLVIVNPGSFPEDLNVFNDDIDILALEGDTVNDVISDARITQTGIPALRWLGIQEGFATNGAQAATTGAQFRWRGGYWFYSTQQYSLLPPQSSPDWLTQLTNWGDNGGRPDCGAPNPSTQCGTLVGGQGLVSGTTQQALSSCSGQYNLVIQSDGNLVIYNGGNAEWASNTDAFGPASFLFGTDGNLGVYMGFGHFANPDRVFQTYTYGLSNPFLAMQDDGNLVVYSEQGAPVWSSKNPHPQTTCGVLNIGEGLTPMSGSAARSCNERYVLRTQPSGDLTLVEEDFGEIWRPNVGSAGNIVHAQMQSDGNFVLYSGYNPPVAVWATNTANHPGAVLHIRDDGNLVIMSGNTFISDRSQW
jgi:hypothetical protein